MQPVLFNSSIHITDIRTGDEAALSLRRLAFDSQIWPSAVVREELYTGIAQDPIGFGCGINFYACVGNKPIDWIDPLGLDRLNHVAGF